MSILINSSSYSKKSSRVYLHLSIYLFIYLSIYLYIYIYLYISIYPVNLISITNHQTVALFTQGKVKAEYGYVCIYDCIMYVFMGMYV